MLEDIRKVFADFINFSTFDKGIKAKVDPQKSSSSR
jgi:hypothetical protein